MLKVVVLAEGSFYLHCLCDLGGTKQEEFTLQTLKFIFRLKAQADHL
jgi:hypothetical protein